MRTDDLSLRVISNLVRHRQRLFTGFRVQRGLESRIPGYILGLPDGHP